MFSMVYKNTYLCLASAVFKINIFPWILHISISLGFRLPEHIHGKTAELNQGQDHHILRSCNSMHRKPAKLRTPTRAVTLLYKLIYRKPSFRNCSCRMSRYSSKPPSIRATPPFSQTHSSWQTRRIKRSSWDTRITPPWKNVKKKSQLQH